MPLRYCSHGDIDPSAMPLSVNGELVSDELIRQETALVRARLAEAYSGEDALAINVRAKEWAQENIIERVLLRQAAIGDSEPMPPAAIDATLFPAAAPDVRQNLETQRRVERFVAKLTRNVGRPRRKELLDFYKKHRDRFHSPELVRAAHIVKNAPGPAEETAAFEGITQAQAELRKGRAFAEVADEMSDCPGMGGNLGWFPRGQMVAEFDAVVFELKPAEVSNVFRTVFGFHIATVLERKSAGIRDFNEVSAKIEEALVAEKREKIVENFVDAMRARAVIVKVKRGILE